MNDYKTFGEYRTSEKSSASTALTFLFIGLGIGTIVALLFAPQSGKKMRKSLRRRYEDAMDSVDDLRDQAGEYVERGRDLARDVKDKVSPIARKFRD
jgi:gas vesicle protein